MRTWQFTANAALYDSRLLAFDSRLLPLVVALALVAVSLALGVDTTEARGSIIGGGGHR
ncbi:MAG: hypothetical protein U0031_16855 [Thermomicrobiales bacterium]